MYCSQSIIFFLFISRLSEYLSRVFYDSSDLDETPDQVKVMHIIHACELALDVREKDQGRKRSMMSRGSYFREFKNLSHFVVHKLFDLP